MLRALFGARRQREAASAAVPAGQRVYAIGDVHGRLDLLVRLLASIEEDDRARRPAESHVVMLGDLIDRGPRSADVVEFFLSRRPGFAAFHFLMGNHEEAMIRSLRPKADPREIGWLQFGGMETLASYGVAEEVFDLLGWQLSDELRLHVPRAHIEFITGFEDSLRFGDYLFAHAGIRPGVALDRQSSRDLRWIRREFLEDESDHGAIVIHGHTITAEPEFRPNRIGIDTGAYCSGVLTALGLEGAERWILATAPGSA